MPPSIPASAAPAGPLQVSLTLAESWINTKHLLHHFMQAFHMGQVCYSHFGSMETSLLPQDKPAGRLAGWAQSHSLDSEAFPLWHRVRNVATEEQRPKQVPDLLQQQGARGSRSQPCNLHGQGAEQRTGLFLPVNFSTLPALTFPPSFSPFLTRRPRGFFFPSSISVNNTLCLCETTLLAMVLKSARGIIAVSWHLFWRLHLGNFFIHEYLKITIFKSLSNMKCFCISEELHCSTIILYINHFLFWFKFKLWIYTFTSHR